MTSGVLETDRLLLCPWSETHTALLARLSSKPDVVRYIGSGIPWAPSTAAEVAARQLEHWREHGFGWRAAIEKATGERVGFMTLNVAGEGTLGLDPSEHEIGWWLDPAAWGRGFAREGGRAMRDEAFGSVHATSVRARSRQVGLRVRPANDCIGIGEVDRRRRFNDRLRGNRSGPLH